MLFLVSFDLRKFRCVFVKCCLVDVSAFLEGFVEHLCIFVAGHRLIAVELAVRIALDGAIAVERIDGIFRPVIGRDVREGELLAHIEEGEDPVQLILDAGQFPGQGLDGLLVFGDLFGKGRTRQRVRAGRA